MKIRTLEELQDAIDKEMAWRKRELTAVKANISGARNFAKETALRSGVTLLYAHWEGAVKNIAYYYLSYVSSLKLPYEKLTFNFFAISLRSEVDKFSTTSKASQQTKIVCDILGRVQEQSSIPTEGVIRTNSNLNSDLFKEILHTVGFEVTEYESYFKLIDEVLLNMRNKIAHGEQLTAISLDEERYVEIHDKIFMLINRFSDELSNAAILKKYLKC